MLRRIALALSLVIALIAAASGQEQEGKLVSGPQDDALLPGPCAVFNINGTYKDRFHCLVCDFGADPVVMVFTQEPKAGEDETFNALTRRLKTAMEQNQEASLRAFVVVLSPDFRTSATDKEVRDREEILKETEVRDKFLARLKDRAAMMDPLILACTTAEGPSSYKVNPKAEVTVVFYQKLRVVKNFTFAPGKMTQADVDAIIDRVEKTVKGTKKEMK